LYLKPAKFEEATESFQSSNFNIFISPGSKIRNRNQGNRDKYYHHYLNGGKG